MNKINSNYARTLILLVLGSVITIFYSCQPNQNWNEELESVIISEEAIDSIDKTGVYPAIYFEKYETAKKNFKKDGSDVDALIWYGRRTAYMGLFQEAIDIYSEGIKRHPKEPQLYRHRGHRFISLRRFDEAIQDFELAVSLIGGKEDIIEQDGLPNAQNIPLSTLHGNIWYHLGLAYYLKNDLPKALRAFSRRTVTERHDDNIVSGGHWLYMILKRMKKDAAAEASLDPIHTKMNVIENMSYYKMCVFYARLMTEKTLVPEGITESSDDVLKYGLGNWYLYEKQDTTHAKRIFKKED